MGKGLMEFLSRGYEVVLLQEVRSDSVPLEIYPGSGYLAYLNPSRRRGYAGTMTLSRMEPISVSRGIGDPRFDDEGRVITIELEEFYVVNAYFPNSQQGLTRLDYKLEFDRAFEGFAQGLRRRKPLVIGGDFNVAHTELDIARPEDNANSAGFTQQERDWIRTFSGSATWTPSGCSSGTGGTTPGGPTGPARARGTSAGGSTTYWFRRSSGTG
jgi:exodeoxyribonuclease III (xth)